MFQAEAGLQRENYSSKGVKMSYQESDREDTTTYKVVVNHEEQYSIWPSDRENPLGWQDVGKIGPKSECLAHIKEVWTDMRPLSLRKQMEQASEHAKSPADSGSSQLF
jgi:MbtH protein